MTQWRRLNKIMILGDQIETLMSAERDISKKCIVMRRSHYAATLYQTESTNKFEIVIHNGSSEKCIQLNDVNNILDKYEAFKHKNGITMISLTPYKYALFGDKFTFVKKNKIRKVLGDDENPKLQRAMNSLSLMTS